MKLLLSAIDFNFYVFTILGPVIVFFVFRTIVGVMKQIVILKQSTLNHQKIVQAHNLKIILLTG